jgi:hypothetical protein
MVQVGVVGDALARDVKGSAVVDRTAIDGQAEAHVDGAVKGHQLDRDVALVVILRDDQVEGSLVGAMEDGIGRNRAMGVDPLSLRGSNGGGDLGVILVTEEAAFATMRVEARDRDPRLDPQPQELIMPRIVARMRSVLALSMAPFSEMWVETWITFNLSDVRSMKLDFDPVRLASMPVCPS